MKLYFFSFLLIGFSAFSQTDHIAIEQEVYVDGDTISGTLLSPLLKSKDIKKVKALVIIIPGSGPTDRDGNIAQAPGNNNSYRQLADSLMTLGIATYRYDKPGVGKSALSKDESDLRFEDNVKVVDEIVKQLGEKTKIKNIYLLGHSEGSLIAMLAAQNNKRVKGIISMAGPASNAYDVLRDQISENIPDSAFREMVIIKIDSVKQGHTVSSPPLLYSLLRPSVQPYMQSWFKYTPFEEIKKVEQPILLVQGGRDLQVNKAEFEKLRENKPGADTLFYPHMNHVLKIVDDSPEQNRAAYMDEDFRLEMKMVEDLVKWLEKVEN